MTENAAPGRYAEISARLRAVRDVFEMQPKEFYEAAGITGGTFYNWETGNHRISIDGALKLRDRYGLTLDWIYCGNVDALPHKVASALRSSPRESHSNESTESPEN